MIIRNQDLVGIAVQEHRVLRDIRDVVAVDAHLLTDEEGIGTAGHVGRLNLGKVENRIASIVGTDRTVCTLRMVDAEVAYVSKIIADCFGRVGVRMQNGVVRGVLELTPAGPHVHAVF
ncbi:hypothetical protein D3C71_1632390 [compost metagenome]